jgi:hypothetical protein
MCLSSAGAKDFDEHGLAGILGVDQSVERRFVLQTQFFELDSPEVAEIWSRLLLLGSLAN